MAIVKETVTITLPDNQTFAYKDLKAVESIRRIDEKNLLVTQRDGSSHLISSNSAEGQTFVVNDTKFSFCKAEYYGDVVEEHYCDTWTDGEDVKEDNVDGVTFIPSTLDNKIDCILCSRASDAKGRTDIGKIFVNGINTPYDATFGSKVSATYDSDNDIVYINYAYTSVQGVETPKYVFYTTSLEHINDPYYYTEHKLRYHITGLSYNHTDKKVYAYCYENKKLYTLTKEGALTELYTVNFNNFSTSYVNPRYVAVYADTLILAASNVLYIGDLNSGIISTVKFVDNETTDGKYNLEHLCDIDFNKMGNLIGGFTTSLLKPNDLYNLNSRTASKTDRINQFYVDNYICAAIFYKGSEYYKEVYTPTEYKNQDKIVKINSDSINNITNNLDEYKHPLQLSKGSIGSMIERVDINNDKDTAFHVAYFNSDTLEIRINNKYYGSCIYLGNGSYSITTKQSNASINIIDYINAYETSEINKNLSSGRWCYPLVRFLGSGKFNLLDLRSSISGNSFNIGGFLNSNQIDDETTYVIKHTLINNIHFNNLITIRATIGNSDLGCGASYVLDNITPIDITEERKNKIISYIGPMKINEIPFSLEPYNENGFWINTRKIRSTDSEGQNVIGYQSQYTNKDDEIITERNWILAGIPATEEHPLNGVMMDVNGALVMGGGGTALYYQNQANIVSDDKSTYITGADGITLVPNSRYNSSPEELQECTVKINNGKVYSKYNISEGSLVSDEFIRGHSNDFIGANQKQFAMIASFNLVPTGDSDNFYDKIIFQVAARKKIGNIVLQFNTQPISSDSFGLEWIGAYNLGEVYCEVTHQGEGNYFVRVFVELGGYDTVSLVDFIASQNARDHIKNLYTKEKRMYIAKYDQNGLLVVPTVKGTDIALPRIKMMKASVMDIIIQEGALTTGSATGVSYINFKGPAIENCDLIIVAAPLKGQNDIGKFTPNSCILTRSNLSIGWSTKEGDVVTPVRVGYTYFDENGQGVDPIDFEAETRETNLSGTIGDYTDIKSLDRYLTVYQKNETRLSPLLKTIVKVIWIPGGYQA